MSRTSNLEPTFKNMMKVRRKFSCGMISAHRLVIDGQSKQKANETCVSRAIDYGSPLREELNDHHLGVYRLSGLTLDWAFMDENEVREKEMVAVISGSGYSHLTMESHFNYTKINSFWIWNDADPGKGNGEILPFLQKLAKDFEQDAFQHIPFTKEMVLYRKELDVRGRWSGNWVPQKIGFISKVNTGQVRTQSSFRLLSITGPH